MSCETIGTLPQISVALGSGAGAALAPAMVGLGLAYGTYQIVKKLRSDYSAAMSEFHMREAEAIAALSQSAQKQAAMAATAQAKGEMVTATTAGVAVDFITNAIAQVQNLAHGEELAAFRTRADELAAKLEAGAEHTALAREAVKLTADIHAALNKLAATGKIKANVAELLVAAKAEIGKVASEEQRASLAAQIQKLEALPAEEFGVALQGIANLRDRVGKVMQTQIADEEEKLRRRQITSEAVAMLQALSKVPDAAEAKQAVAVLEEISKAFAKDKAPSISSLEGFLKKAKALFESCETRLSTAVATAAVSDTVAEVLMEMGYKVSSVPAEDNGCQISLDQDTGMVVSIDKSGQIKTEMVAYSEDAREPDMESQEKVCALVDQVFDALRKRDIEVKEKFRKTMKHGKLNLVERPQEAAPQFESKPKERALS